MYIMILYINQSILLTGHIMDIDQHSDLILMTDNQEHISHSIQMMQMYIIKILI